MSAGKSSRKRRRNRGRFGLLLRLLCAFALLAALFYGVTVFFRVEELTVTGCERYTPQQVVKATGIREGDNLYHFNKNRVAVEVRRALPYIESLTIRRSPPSTVVITVEEWDAVAAVQPAPPPKLEEGEIQEVAVEPWLISVSGKVLEKAPEDTAAIPVTGLNAVAPRAGTGLAVPQDQQDRLNCLLLLLQTLEQEGERNRVSSIDLSGTGYVMLRYDDRFDAKLPLGEELPYHLKVLSKAVATLEDYKTGLMDLTQEEYVVFSPYEEEKG